MKLFQPLLILAYIVVLISLFASCSTPTSTTPAASQETIPPPTTPSAMPTVISPTDTPAPPSPTATATPRPTATLAPNEFIASSVEDLVGIWKHFFAPSGGEVYVQYRPDGTWAIAATLEKLISSPPDTLLEGTFEFDGAQFITVDDLCGTNKEGKYQIRITAEDGQPSRAALIIIEDACRERAGDMRKGLQWVQP